MNVVRIVVAVVMVILFCWLNWWVMPYLAIVRLEEKGVQIPETCYFLMGQKDNKILGLRIIKGIEFDWDGVPAAWPYMLAGMIPALGVGYFLGERARRKFAIGEASQDAVTRAEQIKSDAEKKDSEAQDKIYEANRLYNELVYLKNYLQEQLTICRAVTVTAEDKIRNCDEKIGEMPKIEQELKKAKSVIEKLNLRISAKKKENDKKTNG